MRRTALIMALGVLALVAGPLAAAKHGTVEQKTFTLGNTVTFLNSCESTSGIGGVRFCGVDAPAPAQATVTVRDNLNLASGANVGFWDGAGYIGQGNAVCGQRTLSVPAGTREIHVYVSHAWALPIWEGIGFCVAPGGALGGTVTLAWSAN